MGCDVEKSGHYVIREERILSPPVHSQTVPATGTPRSNDILRAENPASSTGLTPALLNQQNISSVAREDVDSLCTAGTGSLIIRAAAEAKCHSDVATRQALCELWRKNA